MSGSKSVLPELEVTIERVAHGGHAVARHEGRVVFVRGGLPGERVRVRVSDDAVAAYWRAEVIEVLEPAPGRVTPPCPVAGECGGCDLQHASAQAQLTWKTSVLSEQLQRIAGLEWTGAVEPVAWSDEPLLGWRTRMDYRVEGGVVGLRAHRSRRLVPLPEQGCGLAATSGPSQLELARLAQQVGEGDLRIACGDHGWTAVTARRVLAGERLVRHRVAERDFQVNAAGFWQVHPRAAQVLTDVVIEALAPTAGESALDLYCGVGLFAGALVDLGVQVLGVETDEVAVAQARLNVPEARFIAAPVEKVLRRLPQRVDLVVCDPARSGAGKQVVGHLAGLGARGIVHIGCDPAAFARDLRLFGERGWQPEWVRGFDLFPMTQHIESVALLRKLSAD